MQLVSLSILIPTYNDPCLALVESLVGQATCINGLQWEIIVADDGSTDESIVAANKSIDNLPHSTYIIRHKNSGRAAIRNFLAREAHGDYLLFIDADMTIVRDDYLQRYVDNLNDIVYGGYTVGNGPDDNLRYRYERASETFHHVGNRKLKPYRDFHTSNFMIRRTLALANPLDERFHHYGYEDVLYGKQFLMQAVPIRHIDNPTGFCTFEDNEAYIRKTEEGICTLYHFRRDLKGFSNILTAVDRLHQLRVAPLVRLVLHALSPALRRNLCSRRPSLTAFKLYKLGYYLDLEKNHQ